MDQVQNVLKQLNIIFRQKAGITIIETSKELGLNAVKAVLYSIVNTDSALFLSGGSTPKPLYQQMAVEKKLKVGAVGMVDERYGEKMHTNSNELMISETSLLDYLRDEGIRFYPILKDKEIIDTAEDYDETVRYLTYHFNKSVGILGIGEDGHIAGLPPGIQNSEFKIQNDRDMAIHLENFPGPFPKRVTMTYLALSMLDLCIVLAFGEGKKEALELMFTDGSKEEIPARFLTKPEIAIKTLLISDQPI